MVTQTHQGSDSVEGSFIHSQALPWFSYKHSIMFHTLEDHLHLSCTPNFTWAVAKQVLTPHSIWSCRCTASLYLRLFDGPVLIFPAVVSDMTDMQSPAGLHWLVLFTKLMLSFQQVQCLLLHHGVVQLHSLPLGRLQGPFHLEVQWKPGLRSSIWGCLVMLMKMLSS